MLDVLKFVISKSLKKVRLSSVRYSNVHSTAKIESGTNFLSSNIGRYSFCGYDCDIYHADIGCFTSIANQVVIGGANHPMDWTGMSPVFYAGRDSISKKFSDYELDASPKTIIGHDVWIGRSAILLSGVSVSNGAVVGAGSVVTKSVPAYAVVAGNPAKIIRYRFDENIINELEKIKWWSLEDEIIHEISRHIKDPLEFIEAIKALKTQITNS